MKPALVLLGLLAGCGLARAAADEEVVQRMLRESSGISADEIRQHYDDCDGTTFAMRLCGAYRLTVQDIRLNRVYARVVAQSRERGSEAALRQAERAWIRYRDGQCVFEGRHGAGGGTAEPLVVLSCKEALTRQQADRLEALLVQH